MSKIYFKVPSIQELYYRQEWMKDSKTMSYNAGYDMTLKGYDKNTGTIMKTDEEMIEWFYNWTNKEPDKYFAYIYDCDIEEPVGEVYYYLDHHVHCMGILIQNKYRGKGYSYEALLELEKIAFEKNQVSELSDIIPLDRIGAIKSFKKAGFIHTDLEQKELVFGKEKMAKQLLITKKMYFERNERKYHMKEKLLQLLKNSYSPYSNFPVAAILVTKDGKEFCGVNVEDASYRAGACAERVAIFSAIAAGVKKNEMKEMNVMVSSGEIGMPCFVCRQMMLEMFEKDAIVRCFDTNGNYVEHTIEELCPYPFSEEDLKI